MPRKPLDGVTRKTLETGGQASFLPGLLAPAEGGGCGGLAPCKSPSGNGRKKGQKMAFRKRVFSYLDNTETPSM